ncbi:MAG: RIP metalloprotease RseP [Desulfobacterales bacterium]|jgi:regulator of sigma E protease|nr:RIP metalloprotease RseP [Desulfobacterales bacterium]MDP6683690.1 RIP metalloprotease RseP [Desulfobacterales bacterium]MDP6807895.1 RIP metalloprotease RseP [Desulfobacterales bacterium]|tara:strand:+ start:37014 stop:38090 length:1077 start_codon:yes stop_codon:yes gene_type:complete
MTTNIFAFIVVLGVLIFFHELGHFLVARYFGVGVEKFSLGFGPRIFGKKIGITDYRISAIPLGGYVKMVGEEPDAEIDPADVPISFNHKHVFKRILIVAAGPFFNFLLAVIIFFGIFQISGIYILKPSVGRVAETSPAQRGGLAKGDLIVAIDGTPISNWQEMAKMISKSNGKTLLISVRRGESTIDLNIRPELKPGKTIFGEDIDRYLIGITALGDVYAKELNLFGALGESLTQTYKITELTIISIIKLIQGTISTKTLGGPIMIAQMAGEQAKAGAGNLVFFIALISINLAILNFLPIPVLDGGHLLFFFIEAAIGRPVSIKMREIAQQIGIFILILLMIYVFYNDIVRIFFNSSG